MNVQEKNLTFYPVEEKHYGLLEEWFQKEHVRQFYYGEGLENTMRNINLFIQGITSNGEYSFNFWIAACEDEPFGFLMTSRVDGPYDPNDPYNKWFQEGRETITLDLLIGPEKFLGKGLAPRMIREFISSQFPLVDRVLIDPEASNTKAIHVYEKAGFKKIEQFPQQHDEPRMCWMMILDRARETIAKDPRLQ